MFYSQELSKQGLENLCAKCEVRFESWGAYHAHVIETKCVKKIQPKKTTGRTFDQIVTDWQRNQLRGSIYNEEINDSHVRCIRR